MHRLATVLAQPGLPVEDLCSAVLDTLPTRAPSDDVTVLLARTRVLSPGQVVSWDLPTDPAVVSSARSLAVSQLTHRGLQDLATATVPGRLAVGRDQASSGRALNSWSRQMSRAASSG
jgi:hypothetical protein